MTASQHSVKQDQPAPRASGEAMAILHKLLEQHEELVRRLAALSQGQISMGADITAMRGQIGALRDLVNAVAFSVGRH